MCCTKKTFASPAARARPFAPGIHREARRECKDACSSTGNLIALKPAGARVTSSSSGGTIALNECKGISELLEVVEQDWPFYQSSGGGVTVGGGEPMLQPEAVANLLLACKHKGINTAMETCGYARPEVVRQLAEVVDLFLLTSSATRISKALTPRRAHNNSSLPT